MGALLPHYPSEIVMGIVLVLIIAAVVKFVVAPKFEAAYQERRDQIEGGIERADKAQREANEALASYRAQLADARSEAARIREEAKSQGAMILAEIREQATTESDRIIANANVQIAAERTKVLNQLRGEVGGLATNLAERIVGESLSEDERAKRAVDRFIADLEQQPASSDLAQSGAGPDSRQFQGQP